MTPEDQATVFVIDDDARMRTALERLLKSVGVMRRVVCHAAGFCASGANSFSLESQNSAPELHEMKKKTNMCVHEISNIDPDP